MLCVSGGSSDGWSGHGRPTAGMRATSQIRRNGPVFQKRPQRARFEETSGGDLEVLSEMEVGVLTRHHRARENLMNTTATTPTEAVTAALAAHPESSAAELAEAAGIGGSTASKYLAALERDGVAVRRPGGREGGRRIADRWALADTVASTELGGEPDTAVTEGAPTTHDEGSAPRLHKGELSTLVLDYLKDHSTDAIGPSAIGKALGRSSGAVANACQRLEASGSLRLVSDSLRRYQIADA